jgi:hypothetical protein
MMSLSSDTCGVEEGEGMSVKIRQLIIMFVARSNGLAIRRLRCRLGHQGVGENLIWFTDGAMSGFCF